MKKIITIFLLFAKLVSFSQSLEKELLNASFLNDEKLVFDLLRQGANPNSKTDNGITPLMYAVQNANVIIIEKLLKSGADVNAEPLYSCNSLISTILNNDVGVANLLLDYGANPNSVYQNENSPLRQAIFNNNFNACELLLNYGANPNQLINRTTPLMQVVIANSDTSIINLLINFGAKINLQDEYGYTALFYAVFYNNIDAAKCLLKNKANVNITENNKKLSTAFDYAFDYNLNKMIQLLLPFYNQNLNLYHKSAILNDNYKIARIIRKTKKKLYLKPLFNSFIITPKLQFSIDDFIGGAFIGIEEKRYNLDISFGVMPRWGRKKVLIYQKPHVYNQYLESRTMFLVQFNKYFTFYYGNKARFGFFLQGQGIYSYGDFKGTLLKIDSKYTYSIGSGFWRKDKYTRFFIGYNYLQIENENPHYINIGINFLIPIF